MTLNDKHTRGPWNISDDLTSDTHFVISLGGDRHGCILIERHREGFDSEDEPNARLVAAAPDMLKALKAIEHQIGTLKPDASTLIYVRAAIAKAENNRDHA